MVSFLTIVMLVLIAGCILLAVGIHEVNKEDRALFASQAEAEALASYAGETALSATDTAKMPLARAAAVASAAAAATEAAAKAYVATEVRFQPVKVSVGTEVAPAAVDVDQVVMVASTRRPPAIHGRTSIELDDSWLTALAAGAVGARSGSDIRRIRKKLALLAKQTKLAR